MVASATDVRQGELAHLGADGAQAVEARGRKLAVEPERFDQRGLGGGDLDRCCAVVEIAEQREQPAHERRIGVGAKRAAAGAHLAGDPRLRDAAFHAVGFAALGLGQRRQAARAVDDGRETFLRIVDEAVVFDELLLFLGESHAGKLRGARTACKPTGALAGCNLMDYKCRVAARLASGWAGGSTVAVNPFAIGWFWRGFKGRSVTFAVLFAAFVLGLSISHELGALLRRLGVHWLYAIILPAIFFLWLAKREERFMPDEAKRKLWARSVIAGSIGIAILIAWLKK